jgi:hypothetical protein
MGHTVSIRAVNIFREYLMQNLNPPIILGFRAKKSLWLGKLGDLAILALAMLPYNLERPLNTHRLGELYLKSGFGCRDIHPEYPHLCIVDRFHFQKWIRQNHTRILMTHREIERGDCG